MKSNKAKNVAKKEVLAETPEVLLTEVPVADEAALLTEVPEEELAGELIAEEDAPMQVGAPELFIDGPVVSPKAPKEPKTPKTPKATKGAKKKPVTKYTPAQLKKLRGEYSRRTLLTRFGISF